MTTRLFFFEAKKFSLTNWWIYIIFLICLGIIYITESGDIIEITTIFTLHFSADICVMMAEYLALQEFKKATLAKIGSSIIFALLGIYSLIYDGNPIYMIPIVTFLIPDVRNFARYFYNTYITFLSPFFALIL